MWEVYENVFLDPKEISISCLRYFWEDQTFLVVSYAYHMEGNDDQHLQIERRTLERDLQCRICLKENFVKIFVNEVD